MLVPLFLAAILSGNSLRTGAEIPPQPVPVLNGDEQMEPPCVLKIGGAEIQVEIRLEHTKLTERDVLRWVTRAANAVTVFYGRFPVQRVRVIVVQGRAGGRSIHGATWGNISGFQGVSRMRLGTAVSKSDLDSDWTMTHELVHMALASLPDDNHWLEEGLATYVEPIARAQDGQLSSARVWQEMSDGMRQGEPAEGDLGLAARGASLDAGGEDC